MTSELRQSEIERRRLAIKVQGVLHARNLWVDEPAALAVVDALQSATNIDEAAQDGVDPCGSGR